MSDGLVERPQLSYFPTSAPSSHLSPQDVIDLRQLIDIELVPILGWLQKEPEDRDITLLGDYIGMVEEMLLGWREYWGSLPGDKFNEIYSLLEEVCRSLEAAQIPFDDLEDEEFSIGRLTPLPGQVGAPRLALDEQQLRYFLTIPDLTYKQIAGLCMCSAKTVQRRAKEYKQNRRRYTDITQEDLDRAIIRAYLRGSGDQGYRAVKHYLSLEGIRVPQPLIEEACRRINPGATWDRFGKARLRRKYRVPWINSLWHIDGHHKLNLWKIVIHGGIDGFSRRITFLRASSNNMAATVEDCFNEAVGLFGWPSRVRVDYGKENLGVKARMEGMRGVLDSQGRERGTFLQGPSTRNQRIERLWVDLQRWCTTRYRVLFFHYERLGILDRDNDIDLWILHFIYLPIINEALKEFVDVWDRHRIRTAGNRSPSAMWIENMELARKAGVQVIQFLEERQSINEELDQSINEESEEDLSDFDSEDLPEDRTQTYFEDYGVDNYGRRRNAQAQQSDPQVIVPPPEQGLPEDMRALLYEPAFLSFLREEIGPLWPIDQTLAYPQYMNCREKVYARLGFLPPRPNDPEQ